LETILEKHLFVIVKGIKAFFLLKKTAIVPMRLPTFQVCKLIKPMGGN